MTVASNSIDLHKNFVEQFGIFEKELNGKSLTDFHQTRKKAIRSFEQLGMPDRKTENYKYTPITRLLKKQFNFDYASPGIPAISKAAISELLIKGLDAYNVVLINGRFSQELSNLDITLKGLEITDFKSAYESQPDLVGSYFAKYAEFDKDPFTALNTAFSLDGTFIKVKDNLVVDKPIVIYSIADSTAASWAVQPRNLIIAGKNSQASIIENYIHHGNEAAFTNTVSEIIVDENAYIDYYKLEIQGDNAYHVGNTQVYQAGKSTFNTTTISLAGSLIRNNLNVVLDDEHCEANMHGLYLLNDRQHVDNQTMVDHRKPHSYSNELYKGILGGNSTGVFNGKIYVRQDAQKTNAFQSNKNILLSDEASINTKPQLEIWADDVKCSHGATTGQLDKEQLFYLRSRGLGEQEARSLLLYAFAIDALENVKIDVLKEYIDHHISIRLNR